MFPQITYPIVIWGLYAGIVAGAVGTAFSRFTAGAAVRALLAAGATDRKSAVTADEMGLSSLARRALRGSLFGKLFICANVPEAEIAAGKKRNPYKKPRLDMKKARFYLPKEREYEALERFPRQSVFPFIAAVALITALFVLLHFFLPSIVDIFVNAFTS